MTRRASKVDASHGAIVDALREAGCSVQSLAAVGAGCPDLLVLSRGTLYLLEVKQPLGPQGGDSENGQHLNAAQEKWIKDWRGDVFVVRSPEQALRVVGAI